MRVTASQEKLLVKNVKKYYNAAASHCVDSFTVVQITAGYHLVSFGTLKFPDRMLIINWLLSRGDHGYYKYLERLAGPPM